ncbi:MAG: YunC family protein [Limisphaerales bacterium]
MAINLDAFTKTHHPLGRPLLVISGSKGVLCCGYLSLESLERNGDAGAIVKGVNCYDDMLAADIKAVTPQAEALGVEPGMSGAQALELFR